MNRDNSVKAFALGAPDVWFFAVQFDQRVDTPTARKCVGFTRLTAAPGTGVTHRCHAISIVCLCGAGGLSGAGAWRACGDGHRAAECGLRQGALRTNYSARQGIDASQYWRARLEQRLGAQPSALRAGTEFASERAGVAPATARPPGRPVGQWSVGERLAYAVREAASRLGPEVRAKLEAMLTPENVALMVGTLVGLTAVQGVPVLNVVDAALVGTGLYAFGQDAVDVASDLVGFASKVLRAQSEEDLQVAGEQLARAVAVVGVDTVAAVLVHRTVKVVRGGAKPPSGAAEVVTPEGVRVRVVAEPAPRSAVELLRSSTAEGGSRGAGIANNWRSRIIETQGRFLPQERPTSRISGPARTCCGKIAGEPCCDRSKGRCSGRWREDRIQAR